MLARQCFHLSINRNWNENAYVDRFLRQSYATETETVSRLIQDWGIFFGMKLSLMKMFNQCKKIFLAPFTNFIKIYNLWKHLLYKTLTNNKASLKFSNVQLQTCEIFKMLLYSTLKVHKNMRIIVSKIIDDNLMKHSNDQQSMEAILVTLRLRLTNR